ncbi:endolytic transglycosylase MltG [Streptomyces sp. 21So2-11]|uniref:endolytic transglycosylase MltG n=1 Tax=Streptomyces sp. 21So2-11 TaxID=3144408 RepID=UPI00321B2420
MTDYGRGTGREPWHPDDPLYGDPGWDGQQAAHGQGSYGGQRQQPQQPYYDGQQQQPPQQPYYDGQQPHQPPYDGRQHQQQPHQQQQPQQPGYPDQQQYNNAGWDTGQQQGAVPYDVNPADPYGGQQPGYGGESPDYYGTPEAYPPPQPPGQRHSAPDENAEWDGGPEAGAPEEHPFFTGADDRDDDGEQDDDPDENGRGRGGDRRGKTKKKKKSRTGCACLVLSLVMAGGVGGVAYFGYEFWQDRFGEPADFVGAGTGSVEITVPKGAGTGQIGSVLEKEGVVKSAGAFVSVAAGNPKAQGIQPGVYPLKKEMSAKAALEVMINPSNLNALIISEGWRNVKIYAEIDKRLKLKDGTTRDVARSESKNLGLPGWANDNTKIKDPLEGFLYPARYDVGRKSTPKSVLKEMVSRASGQYASQDLEAQANRLGLDSPLQLVTVASLVQAEGKTHDDFRKMAEVVYNRLKPDNDQTNQKLQFDSAFNYLRGQSNIKISESEINSNPDPYNTYFHKGLTPGPIGNPGSDAMAAALNPTKDGWLYFVATDGENKTEFAKTIAEFNKLKDKFNESQGIG